MGLDNPVSVKKIRVAFAEPKTKNRKLISFNEAFDSNIICAHTVADCLEKRGFEVILHPVQGETITDFTKEIKKIGANEVVFNLFEGLQFNSTVESLFAEMLEKNNVRFTGNSSLTLKVTLNKYLVKKVLKAHGIRSPNGFLIRSFQDIVNFLSDAKYPVFVKPACEDASLGIDEHSIISSFEEAQIYIPEKLERFSSGGMLVEEFLPGREFCVGLLGIYPYKILPVSMIDHSLTRAAVPAVTYKAKWENTSEEYQKIEPVFELPITHSKRAELEKIAAGAGNIFGCRGYFRVDVREDARGNFYVLDINANPDISSDAGLAKQANQAGMDYSELIYNIAMCS